MNEAVRNSLVRRITTQHLDLLKMYGLVAVTDAINEQASFVGEVEEIGSSDISCWVKDIARSLASRVYGPLDV